MTDQNILLDYLPPLTGATVAVTALVLFVAYIAGDAVYQLYFSPLSIFPGPKLAAVTLGYEIYYDVVQWGRYHVRIREMHEEYGPIIRINPFELHVSDPHFIDTLYSRAAPRDKHAYMTRQFGNPLVTFSTDDHGHHRVRRAALNPFFSKQRVLGLQEMIWTHVEKLCARVEEFKGSARLLNVGSAFGCLAADVIIEYAVGHRQNALDDGEFAPLFTQAVKKFASVGVVGKHVPWIHAVMRGLPQRWIAAASPEYGAMLAFRALNNQRVREVYERLEKRRDHDEEKDNATLTIFDALFNSSLSTEEKSLERLSQESQLIIGAALDTTANALTATLFHLLAQPSKLQCLKEELAAAMPNARVHPPLPQLESLPYLSAVINEGLRLSHGVSSRNARIAHTPLVYAEYTIPAGTPVGMSAPLTHLDESIFPDANEFVPERWIDGRAPDGQPLERYLMAFGRGSRQCAGMNLARAEMCIAIAAVVRRFEMKLWETTRRDVDMVHDLFLPHVDANSKGVRVVVD